MPEGGDVVLAIDQGTSATKVLAVAPDGTVVHRSTVRVAQRILRSGWVEQDATEILDGVIACAERVLKRSGGRVAAVGLSTQRESAIVWDRRTGRPLGPVLGWQDRRTAERAHALVDAGHAGLCREISGLPLDPMFSALKFGWLLDSVDPDRRRSRAGELALGTVDSFLMSALTGSHQIEAGNASRTLLMDVRTATWSPELLELFDIPERVLPRIVRSDAHTPITSGAGLPGVAVTAVLGDSHAALYGHGVRTPGTVKVTYGTGASVMGLVAPGADVTPGLTRTVAWQLGAGPVHAFEGNILSAGATLVWLGEMLHATPGQLVEMAFGQDHDQPVDLVPAFAGLGAPWWRRDVSATLTGFTLGTGAASVARAAVDSIALQVEDVLAEAERSGADLDTILLDGGPSANDWLVQLQADLSQRTVRRSAVPEMSALGVAALAATSAGLAEGAAAAVDQGATFRPRLAAPAAAARRERWTRAVRQVLDAAPRTAVRDAVASA